jgi:hypothetical protein
MSEIYVDLSKYREHPITETFDSGDWITDEQTPSTNLFILKNNSWKNITNSYILKENTWIEINTINVLKNGVWV